MLLHVLVFIMIIMTIGGGGVGEGGTVLVRTLRPGQSCVCVCSPAEETTLPGRHLIATRPF